MKAANDSNSDFRNRISSDASCDDHRHFEFVRNSRLPHSTFQEGWNLNQAIGATVVIGFLACAVLMLLHLAGVV